MKKIIISISLVATLGLGANAQMFTNTQSQSSDGFFTTSTPGGNYREGSANDGFPVLPGMGVYDDQLAPLGSGLLLLAGMGLAYAVRRRNS